jgi:MFS family permease
MLMSVALALLATFAGQPSRTTVAVALALFGVGFGMVGQVLIIAVQNSVDRRQLGIAMAATSFFRALGGAVGAAVLGAVFAARAGTHAASGPIGALRPAVRADIIDGVQSAFVVAAPIAAIAFIVVLLLKEVPLRGPGESSQRSRPSDTPAEQAGVNAGGRRSPTTAAA